MHHQITTDHIVLVPSPLPHFAAGLRDIGRPMVEDPEDGMSYEASGVQRWVESNYNSWL